MAIKGTQRQVAGLARYLQHEAIGEPEDGRARNYECSGDDVGILKR
ncbi:MAG: hypothetical protein IPI73_07520 [Betaproteobacteria bacterium]|nr:hypothetical protein [Betaproteobacteria bacterium]